MSVQTNRLGKGLDALIPSMIPNTQLNIQQLPVEKIIPNPYQPRKHFEPNALQELANSIKTHGLAQPVLVRCINDQYELIVGQRRLEATKLNGQTTIPSIIKNISDKESCEIALVENIDRENLNIIEVGQSFKQLISEFNYTQETLSELFSRSRSSIANILRLLKLPKSIQTLVIEGNLSEGHARTLVEFAHDEHLCNNLAQQIIDENLSVRQAEKLITSLKKKPKKQPQQLNLFENYTERLSEKYNTNFQIKHQKNKLTISVEYSKFKDYIDFLDALCNSSD